MAHHPASRQRPRRPVGGERQRPAPMAAAHPADTRPPWTPFLLLKETTDLDGSVELVWQNSRYRVHARRVAGGPPPLVHLSICEHDQGTRHDWRDFQRIKNELAGASCEAIEA